MRLLATALAAALLTAGAFVGLGYAQGILTGVINACFFDRFGWLRLVDELSDCRRHESPVSWSVQATWARHGPTHA